MEPCQVGADSKLSFSMDWSKGFCHSMNIQAYPSNKSHLCRMPGQLLLWISSLQLFLSKFSPLWMEWFPVQSAGLILKQQVSEKGPKRILQSTTQ